MHSFYNMIWNKLCYFKLSSNEKLYDWALLKINAKNNYHA